MLVSQTAAGQQCLCWPLPSFKKQQPLIRLIRTHRACVTVTSFSLLSVGRKPGKQVKALWEGKQWTWWEAEGIMVHRIPSHWKISCICPANHRTACLSFLYYSPLKSTIRVVLGQQIFNKTTDVTQTFEIEKYILHPEYSVFNPTEHDIGEYFCSVLFSIYLTWFQV